MHLQKILYCCTSDVENITSVLFIFESLLYIPSSYRTQDQSSKIRRLIPENFVVGLVKICNPYIV